MLTGRQERLKLNFGRNTATSLTTNETTRWTALQWTGLESGFWKWNLEVESGKLIHEHGRTGINFSSSIHQTKSSKRKKITCLICDGEKSKSDDASPLKLLKLKTGLTRSIVNSENKLVNCNGEAHSVMSAPTPGSGR